MNDSVPSFSVDQWNFLSILEAFGEPVSMDVVNELAPLTPSSLFGLINIATELGWLHISKDHDLSLNANLPELVIKTFSEINTEARIAELLKQIQETGIQSKLSKQIMTRLMHNSGQGLEAAQLDYEMASKAFSRRDFTAARKQLEKVLAYAEKQLEKSTSAALYIRAVLDLSKLQQRMSTRFDTMYQLLVNARDIAKQLGDKRNQTLLNMHIGWHFIYLADYTKGLSILADAIEMVDILGDEDIKDQSAEFFGIYFFHLGLYDEANKYFEKALQASTKGVSLLLANEISMFTAYSAIITGKIQRAVGILDSGWHRALMENDHHLATRNRASLAVMLILWNEKHKALPHIQACLAKAENQINYWALHEATGAMANYYYLEDNLEESYKWIAKSCSYLSKLPPFATNPVFPQFIEMLIAFNNSGYEPIPGYNYQGMMDSLINGVNIHQNGFALYIQAKLAITNGGGDTGEIRRMLEKSARDLERSGDVINLARCRVELARIYFQNDRQDEAKDLALKAWEILAGYGNTFNPHKFFPDSLKPLLGISSLSSPHNPKEDLLDCFMDMLEETFPSSDIDNVLRGIVSTTSRFFEAERGGIFLIENSQPVFHAGYNLTHQEVMGEGFRFSLEQIRKVSKNTQPLVLKGDLSRNVCHISGIVCIPFTLYDEAPAVLYQDNSYTDLQFEYLDRSLLMRISRYLSTKAICATRYPRAEEQPFASQGTPLEEPADERYEMKAESPVMKELLARARQVAISDASVLILGETGVGKELLARQLHAMSHRNMNPFIVVDLTSTPETLVESELFGHEKGAFTGADRLKQGRMELAHKGTLFIDEVGDIPKSAQTKLLRSLQEKAFSRVGGTRSIHSDFRLVAATNRDLAKEVEHNNFREDLYYRLNVVPLEIPPLRNRGNDVITLALHFLSLYTNKYRRPLLRLTQENKAKLMSYTWPGNVRELKNVIERAVIMSSQDRPELVLPMNSHIKSENPFKARPKMDELQRQYIEYILDQTDGKLSGSGGAAEILGMKRSTLYTRMLKLGLIDTRK